MEADRQARAFHLDPLDLRFKSNRMNKTLHLSKTEALHTVWSTALNYFMGHLESQGPVIFVEIP